MIYVRARAFDVCVRECCVCVRERYSAVAGRLALYVSYFFVHGRRSSLRWCRIIKAKTTCCEGTNTSRVSSKVRPEF